MEKFKALIVIASAMIVCAILQGCASSEVSRNAENQINSTYQNAASAFDGNSINVAEAYQGSSQKTKGLIIGGATGAVIGGLTSSWAGVLPGAAGGAIFGGALGAYIDSKASVADQIVNRGNKVIVLGDQVLIVLPSSRVFAGNSPNLQPYAYKTLDLVSQLINGYPNMSVKVTVYNDSHGSERINRPLSQEQANAVVKYLWRTRINTRLLYAVGGDGSKPVTASSDWSSATYRVEITLEKLPI